MIEDLVFTGTTTELEIQLGGLTPGTEYDQLLVGGNATLAGAFNVSLANGFALAAGQSFLVLDVTGTLEGQFAGMDDGQLVNTFGGTDLYVTYTAGDGNDVALYTAPPGDFDFDGEVDGRDFLIWQQGGSPDPLSASDLADWQLNFGEGALITASVAVPEPRCVTLLILGALATLSRQRRLHWRLPRPGRTVISPDANDTRNVTPTLRSSGIHSSDLNGLLCGVIIVILKQVSPEG